MVILICGASHTGKTIFAQKLLEAYNYPYLSIDHIKMGLIRSKQTFLTPEDDDKLTDYLWPIIKEIIKTAIENDQNLVIEGLYIPFDWKKDFGVKYLSKIKFLCLIMSKRYIEANYDKIISHACDIEKRVNDFSFNQDYAIKENLKNLQMCNKYNCEYILIDKDYNFDIKI